MEKKSKKKKKVSYIILLVSFSVFLVSITGLYLRNDVLERREIYVNINVTTERNIGFDLNNSALTFGKISKGGTSARNLVFTNNYNFPVVVNLNSEGGVAPFLDFQKKYKVGRNETTKFPILAYVANDAEGGVYEGKIIVEIKRAPFSF